MKVTVEIMSERTGMSAGMEGDYDVKIEAEVDVAVHRDVYGTGDSPDEAECDVLRVWLNGEEYDTSELKEWEEMKIIDLAWDMYSEAQYDGKEYEREDD